MRHTLGNIGSTCVALSSYKLLESQGSGEHFKGILGGLGAALKSSLEGSSGSGFEVPPALM